MYLTESCAIRWQGAVPRDHLSWGWDSGWD